MNAALQRFAAELRRLRALALSSVQRGTSAEHQPEVEGDRSSASDLLKSPSRVQRDIGAAGLERSVAGASDGSAPPITLVGMNVSELARSAPHAQALACLRQGTGA